MSARDSQRSRVYAAEQFVRTLFDHAAGRGSRAIDFFGDSITLPPEARFGSVASVQLYVDAVLALPVVADRWPGSERIAVRPSRASTAAHYEIRDGTAVIAVPETGAADWAMRELVVLHEVAHHLNTGGGGAHGPNFVATFCELAALVMGSECGHVLRVVYSKEGVR